MKRICLLVMILLSQNSYTINISIPEIKSSYFKKQHVFNGFGCTGSNQFPEIRWTNLSKDAKYVAITMYDPDAPTGGGWWHWLISNIPAGKFKKINTGNYKEIIKEGAVESMTSYGKAGYGGPCPPKGDNPHRYIINVYSLAKKVSVKASNQPGLVGYQLNANKITKASTTFLFGR